MGRLDGMSIEDLCQQASAHGVELAGGTGSDFAI
jgi:hypothetical protein